MAVYAIGDVQGCHAALQQLLKQLAFDPRRDRLLFAGDLVNRGPESLECLRYVSSLGGAAVSVLGNHDLHLLAVAAGGKPGNSDTFDAILHAPDRPQLLDWLRRQPLAYQDPQTGVLLVHAGIVPQWTARQTLDLAAQASAALSSAPAELFFAQMYGDQPDLWDEGLTGSARWRFIINCLTRLRYCDAQGRMSLRPKGAPGTQPAGLLPWFQAPGRRSEGTPIICGHWSTLGQVHWPEQRVWGLDTGCVWGGSLTALELGSGALFATACTVQAQAVGHGD